MIGKQIWGDLRHQFFYVCFGCGAVGGDDTTDIVIRSFDTTDLEEEAGAQFGGDMDDAVQDIARNSDEYYIVIVGSTESESDHLFDLDTPSESTNPSSVGGGRTAFGDFLSRPCFEGKEGGYSPDIDSFHEAKRLLFVASSTCCEIKGGKGGEEESLSPGVMCFLPDLI